MTLPNPATKILNKAYCRHLLKRAFDLKNTTGSAAPASPPLTSSKSPAAFRVPASNLNAPTRLNAGPSIGAAQAQPNTSRPAPVVPFLSSRAPTTPAQFQATQQAIQNARAVKQRSVIAPPPSVGRAFMGGAGQGVKNMFGAGANFVKGMANFAAGGALGLGAKALSGYSGNPFTGSGSYTRPAVNNWANQWLQASEAGARDMAESFGQFVGVNNAWQDGQYVGAQAPQNVNQQRTAIEQKYFSNPADTDLHLAYRGVNNAADRLSESVPSVMAGHAVVHGLSKVPVLANAGNTVSTAIQNNRFLNPALKVTAVGTGLPLHPAVLPGGRLAGWAATSQILQNSSPFLVPPVGDTVEQSLQTATNYLPVPAIDRALRENAHPLLPEIIDGVFMPSVAKGSAPYAAFAEAMRPAADAQEQAMHDAMQRAYALDTKDVHDARELFSGKAQQHFVTNTMMQDPAMINRMQHGNVPFDVATQIADEQPLGKTPEEAMQNALAMTANDPQTQATAEFAQAKQELLQPNFDEAVVQNYSTRLADLQKNNASPEEINSTIDEFVQHASQNNSPEEYAALKQETDVLRTQLAAKPVEEKQQLAAAVQNPTGPEAQALVAQKEQEVGQQAVDAAANNPDTPPPADPAGYGQFINDTWTQAVTTFREMDPMMQLGMSLGVGTGLLGLLSSLGGGGIGTFLLGALGLGAAGFMGANAGMFGQNAQNFADDIKYNIGSALGMIPEVNKAELAPLLSDNPIAELGKQNSQVDPLVAISEMSAMGEDGPDRYAKEKISPQIERAETQLAKLQEMTQQTPYMVSRVTGHSLADAQKMIQNAKLVLADAQNPQGELGAQLARARAFTANPKQFLQQELSRKAEEAAAKFMEFFNGSAAQEEKKGNDMNIAQRILMEQLITKTARCWAGYEPVPGKKPYSNNSCRPVGGKKKKKKPATK